MNEIANYCELIGADIDMIRKGIGTDSRIGKRFLFPGIGYGGSCFPKDVKALKKAGSLVNYNFKIIDAVMEVNQKQKVSLVDKVKSYFGDDLSGLSFALWGLAFKPETDDIREAPALYIIEELLASGANVVSYDPEASKNVKNIIGDKIKYAENSYDALVNADALLIATEWSAFRNPDFSKIQSLMKSSIIFDGRNLYDISSMEERSFYYQSIGRRTVNNLNK
jgi:UDPglucose 6-dehydrogenase